MRFKAVGNAPIMKQNLYKITASNRFQAVIQFLRKELGWKATDPLVRFSPILMCPRAQFKARFSLRISTLLSHQHLTTQFQISTRYAGPISSDEAILILSKSFATEGHLIVNYRFVPLGDTTISLLNTSLFSTTAAWG